jgi:hypothetical protein
VVVATAAAAARLGVEPPASSPEDSPRFPAPRDRDGDTAEDLGSTGVVGERPGLAGDTGERPGLAGDTGDTGERLGSASEAGDGVLSATRPDIAVTGDEPAGDAEATQPVAAAGTAESAETTQPTLPESTAETTQPTPAEAVTEASDGEGPAGDGDGQPGSQDATQRLEPVGNTAKGRPPAKPPARSDKG